MTVASSRVAPGERHTWPLAVQEPGSLRLRRRVDSLCNSDSCRGVRQPAGSGGFRRLQVRRCPRHLPVHLPMEKEQQALRRELGCGGLVGPNAATKAERASLLLCVERAHWLAASLGHEGLLVYPGQIRFRAGPALVGKAFIHSSSPALFPSQVSWLSLL